ncbi:PREDICTED: vegetative incompatibility protein HET-E-1 [Tarenaya hassleriana]|uniref:vegetative incompatibility protein HET-E-1 n=1 Tax=Tarenaya hassleriana TaxID=28532 RepID=UPI00053C5BE3|nr:PREDICTED: vegetative incompatibility protein HET-E-1 [Tarenaya hassleriana]
MQPRESLGHGGYLAESDSSSFSFLHECLTTLTGHASYISSLALSGKRLYAGFFDGDVKLWSVKTLLDSENEVSRSNLITPPGGGAVKSLVVLEDRLFTAHQDHKIRVWRINDEESDGNNGGSSKRYMRLATLPTLGDRFAKCLMPKNQVQVRRHKKSTWVHHVDAVSGLALSRDGALLYSVSWDRTLKIWRTSDCKCLESITNAHDDAVNALAIADDGDIYSGSADRTIKIWRKHVEEKKHSLVSTLSKHNSGINALALSSNASLLFSGACDGSVFVWERDNDGEIVVAGVLRGHTESILCLAIVLDILCSGSADKTVRIWRSSARDCSCLAVLEGHKGPVKCLSGAASEESYLIYSGGLDCDIKIWTVLVPPL